MIKYPIRLFVLTGIFLFAGLTGLHGQGYEITGKVTDSESREPLPFVNIRVNDLHHGCSTDIDGKFSFRSSEPVQKISASYVGYETMDIEPVNNPENIVIRLKKTRIELAEVVVLPSENPAHRIIGNAIANRERNRPENLPSFSYTSYDKMYFTVNSDSLLLRPDSLVTDSSDLSLKNYLEEQYLFLMETVSERKYLSPGKNQQNVIATRISGLKDPMFVFLISQMQSASFYNDLINMGDKNYINPVSKGSLQKYFFQLEDTLYADNQKDTTYIISFRPLKNTNFDGMKGVLSITTDKWAIRNVNAEPAEQSESMEMKIQQLYELVDTVWFPVQLNIEFILKNVLINKYHPIGIGKSYHKDIIIGPELNKRDFSHIDISVDPTAPMRKDDFWIDYRNDSLTSKERNTYHYVDSVSKAQDLEKKLKWAEALLSGRIRYKYIEFDLHRFLRYNDFEGFAPGVGLYTSPLVSSRLNTGGYFRYGMKDNSWKYGLNANYTINRKHDTGLGLNYSNDVEETGNSRIFDDNYAITNIENYRDLLINRMNFSRKLSVKFNFRTLKYVLVNLGMNVAEKETIDDYRFRVSDHNLAIYTNSFRFTELTAGFRFAYREKFIKNLSKKVSLGTKYPILQLRYSRGLKKLFDGGYDYNRIDLKVDYSMNLKYLGKISVRLMGGYIDSPLPATNLFNGLSSHMRLMLYSPNSFSTMRMNEFFSDRYAAIFITHDFKKLLYKSAKFSPEFALSFNYMIGDLKYPDPHYFMEYSVPDKGYAEAGLLINNLLNLKVYEVGFGAYYRLGPYSFDKTIENFSFKISLNYPWYREQ